MTDTPVVVLREPGRSPLYVALIDALEVGRGGSGLLVDDPAVSRRHLELRPQDHDVLVVDLGSANGTTLDGEPVTEPMRLDLGSTVRLGDTTIERAAPVTRIGGSDGAGSPVTSIERVAAEAVREQTALGTADPGTVTIVFSDIEGSTELARSFGDELWFDVLGEHNEVIRRQVASTGGREIKSVGDGFMLAFASARRALECAIGVQRAVAEMGGRDSTRTIRVRLGAHTGEVIVGDDGDLFGHHVNVAARIAGQASGDEILVSSLVREIVQARREVRFGEPRSASLKGLDGTWLLHPVLWRD